MGKYKVALSNNVRGISEHNTLKAARESRNKNKKRSGYSYHIYKWVEGSRHAGSGWWFHES